MVRLVYWSVKVFGGTFSLQFLKKIKRMYTHSFKGQRTVTDLKLAALHPPAAIVFYRASFSS